MHISFLCLLILAAHFAHGEIAEGGNVDSLPSYFKQTESINADTSPFAQWAKECGETNQAACTPDHFGGKTMCGRAVGDIIQCMGKAMGHAAECTGKCGNGKDFVDCKFGALDHCSYKRIVPVTSKECKLPGAVLAYTQTPTERGQLYGHVEFVCGNELYCSIYSESHHKPWPRETPDGCWYPDLSKPVAKEGS